MKYYFIIHGFKGSNIENWFPWLKKQIDDENNLCVIPQFPIDDKHHYYNEWKKLLDIYNSYNMMNQETIIIGHSTGSICALKYILESQISINKLILISGFNNYISPDKNDIHNIINPTYYVNETEIAKIKNYVNEIVCLYGDNDPYIPQSVLHDFAKSLNAREVVIHNGGHLNLDAGYDSFEEILNLIRGLYE